MAAGNATLFEWGRSPVVYKTTKAWERIWTAAKEYFSEKAALYHYWASAKNTYLHHLIAPQVMYKKYIYALRPLLACRYIEETHSIPPVLFSELAGQCLPEYLKQETAQLLDQGTGASSAAARYPGLYKNGAGTSGRTCEGYAG